MCLENIKFVAFISDVLIFQALKSKCTKTDFRLGLRPGPTGRAYNDPAGLLVGWGHRRSQRSGKNCTTVLAVQRGQIVHMRGSLIVNVTILYAAEMSNVTDLWLSGVFFKL